jgi:hypothetical protein
MGEDSRVDGMEVALHCGYIALAFQERLRMANEVEHLD